MKKVFWFVLTLALVLSACGAPATEAPAPVVEEPAATEAPMATEAPVATEAPMAEPFRVAVVMPSATTDLAFGQSMYDALVRVQEEWALRTSSLFTRKACSLWTMQPPPFVTMPPRALTW